LTYHMYAYQSTDSAPLPSPLSAVPAAPNPTATTGLLPRLSSPVDLAAAMATLQQRHPCRTAVLTDPQTATLAGTMLLPLELLPAMAGRPRLAAAEEATA